MALSVCVLSSSMTSDTYQPFLQALCLWREARGQSDEAKRAILHVILNRAAHKFRGTDPASVILWPLQFSSFNSGIGSVSAFPVPPSSARPGNPLDWKAWLDCCLVVDSPGEDQTGGAVMYHSYPAGSSNWPAWASSDKQTAHIGPFWFYKV